MRCFGTTRLLSASVESPDTGVASMKSKKSICLYRFFRSKAAMRTNPYGCDHSAQYCVSYTGGLINSAVLRLGLSDSDSILKLRAIAPMWLILPDFVR